MYEDIKKRVEEVIGNYEAIKAQTESAVVRWRYSVVGQLWNYQPIRQGITRNYITTEETYNADEAKYAYGYDAEGRVICVRFFNIFRTTVEIGGNPQTDCRRELGGENFISYIENFMEVVLFTASRSGENSKQKLYAVNRLWMENGKVIEMEEYRLYSGMAPIYLHDLYSWEGEMLRFSHSLDEKGNAFLEFIYDETGGNKCYQILKSGEHFELGQPLPDGVTVKQLLKAVHQILLKRIPLAVQAAKIKEPIYCLVLSYEGYGNAVFNPTLSIGFESKRQALLQSGELRPWYEFWTHPEFKDYDYNVQPFDDDELQKAFDWLNTELEKSESTQPAVNLLIDLAVELERLDWSKITNVTPDFCVVAANNDQSDLYDNLKKIVSRKKLAALEAAGFVEREQD